MTEDDVDGKPDPVTEYLRKIGTKGGQNSIAKLSKSERTKRAQAGAAARWGNKVAEKKAAAKKIVSKRA